MSFNVNYPEQRYIVSNAILRRDCVLPTGVSGLVTVQQGQRVDAKTVVARGQLPSYHYIVETGSKLGLRRRRGETLSKFLVVEVGDSVEVGTELARKNRRRVVSPYEGIVAGIDGERVIIKDFPTEIELEAGVQGSVIAIVDGRGCIVQSQGAVLQGVWGNGKRVTGALRMEPELGMEYIEPDDLSVNWRGSVVISRLPLSALTFAILEGQDIGGVIAPSMDSTLIDMALQLNRAVLLTEGFGNMTTSSVVQNFFTNLVENYPNAQATLDAVVPAGLEMRRPELLVSLPFNETSEPQELNTSIQLRVGIRVRITHMPYEGQTGVVVELPKQPIQIGNSLRLQVAYIQMGGGDVVPIPIANLEVFAG